MRRVLRKLKNLVSLLRKGEFHLVWHHLKEWVNSSELSYGLRRDLNVPFPAPEATIPISVHPLTMDEALKVFGSTTQGNNTFILKSEQDFYEAGVKTCYVAVTDEGEPTYIQWLIGPESNDIVRSYFRGLFPNLEKGQALLEYAYTLEEFRGQRIMPCAMAQIAERGKDIGASEVITFVDIENIAALKGCQRAGFSPYLLRTEKWYLFRRKIGFTLLPPGTPYPYEKPEIHPV